MADEKHCHGCEDPSYTASHGCPGVVRLKQQTSRELFRRLAEAAGSPPTTVLALAEARMSGPPASVAVARRMVPTRLFDYVTQYGHGLRARIAAHLGRSE